MRSATPRVTVGGSGGAESGAAGRRARSASRTWERFAARQLDLVPRHLELGRWLYHGTVAWVLVELWIWRHSAFAGRATLAAALIAVGLACCAGVLFRETARAAAIVLWGVLKILFAICLDGYTADDAIELVSLAWIFAPLPSRALAGRAPRSAGVDADSAPFALVLIVALALLYLDSVPFKLHSRIWREGSALWLGAALPLHGWGLLGGLPELAGITRLATWLTLVFESLFFLALLRVGRLALVPVGLVMHLGSAVLLPLPQFGLALAGALLPLLPSSAAAESTSRAAPVARGGRAAAVVVALAMCVSQVAVHFQPYHRRDPLSFVLGIRQRPIYLDWHFALRGPVMRFELRRPAGSSWIPSFDEQGYPQVRDRYWKILGWVARSRPDGAQMIDRYLRAWFAMRGAPPTTVELWCRDPALASLRIDHELVTALEGRAWTRCGSWQPDRPGRLR